MKMRRARRTPHATPQTKNTFRCSWCGGVFSRDEFYKRKSTKTGYYSYCKTCASDPTRQKLTAKQGGKPDKAKEKLLARGKKMCPKCRKILHVDDFHKNPRTPSGRYSRCKRCHLELVKGPYVLSKTLTCEACGNTLLDLCQMDVDHMNENHSDNRPENLCSLCANCHRLKSLRSNLFYSQYPHLAHKRHNSLWKDGIEASSWLDGV